MIKISDTEYFSNDGMIRFLCMDCNVFMNGLKENEFDLNLSDPPYGLGAKLAHKGNGRNAQSKFSNEFKQKGWDNEIPDKQCFDNIFKTAKNQIIWGGNYFDLPPNRGFIIWDKMVFIPTMSRIEQAYCSIDRLPRLIQINNTDKNRIHLTQKPIDLYRWVLQNYTKESDTILDCFGGSMSNAIACHMERRNLTIIELDIDYFKSALKRFEVYESQLTLF